MTAMLFSLGLGTGKNRNRKQGDRKWLGLGLETSGKTGRLGIKVRNRNRK